MPLGKKSLPSYSAEIRWYKPQLYCVSFNWKVNVSMWLRLPYIDLRALVNRLHRTLIVLILAVLTPFFLYLAKRENEGRFFFTNGHLILVYAISFVELWFRLMKFCCRANSMGSYYYVSTISFCYIDVLKDWVENLY